MPSVTDTLNQTTKGLPIVGGVTEPLLDTVGGVTDGLPIVSCSNLLESCVVDILFLGWRKQKAGTGGSSAGSRDGGRSRKEAENVGTEEETVGA